MVNRVVLCVLIITLQACQSNTGGIGTSMSRCCPESGYRTFSSEVGEMPAFLVPLIKTNFDAAFGARGMVLNPEQPDLHVVLSYEQEDLSSPAKIDEFEGHLAPGGNVRYLATVNVDVFATGTQELVWSGSIQRIHDVNPGEYMHTGKASLAIFQAFTRLLDDFHVVPQTY